MYIALVCTCSLQIQLGPKRVLPLLRFRGAVRPVIIAGDRSFVERCIREGETRMMELRQRGVSGNHRDLANLPCQPPNVIRPVLLDATERERERVVHGNCHCPRQY